MKKEQNEISSSFLAGSDLGEREQEVLKDIVQQTGFLPERLLSRSSWWTSKAIGAFHYAGKYQGKVAVLKVQGVKPATSEADMINAFAKANKSRRIRPPYVYASLPWDDKKRYEALLLERIDGPTVVHLPTTQEELQNFFTLREDYRMHSLHSPWLEKPKASISDRIVDSFAKWQQASAQLYPHHPFRKKEDSLLIQDAVALLSKGYEDIEPEFQHGHFSAIDLYYVGDQVVLLSNLYWSWRPPFYDAVFGYHWHIYSLSSVEGIISETIETQRALWLHHIEMLSQTRSGNDKLLTLALLERAVAGLNLDVLSIDPQLPITAYLVSATREQVWVLVSRLKHRIKKFG